MSDDLKQQIEKSLQDLRLMRDIMDSEGETNWIRGIRSAIAAGEALHENPEDTFHKMSLIYRAMHGGSGSFSDYFIWRDDFDERSRANKELTEVSERLWKQLGF